MTFQRKLNARSERVKSVDLHPTEPWVLASLYNGNVLIWDYKTEVCDSLIGRSITKQKNLT